MSETQTNCMKSCDTSKKSISESSDDCKDSSSQKSATSQPNQLKEEAIEKACESSSLNRVNHDNDDRKAADTVDHLDLGEETYNGVAEVSEKFESQWLALFDNATPDYAHLNMLDEEDFLTNASPEVLETAEAFYFGNSASPEFCGSENDEVVDGIEMLNVQDQENIIDEALVAEHIEDITVNLSEVTSVVNQQPNREGVPLPIDDGPASMPITRPISPPINYALSATQSGTSHISLSPVHQPPPPSSPQMTLPDFASMPLSAILPLDLTIRELVDFNLLARFMACHNGSRYVQRIMESLSGQGDEREVLVLLLRHLVHHPGRLLWQMSTSVYGNYLVQLLFKKTYTSCNDVSVRQLFETFLFPSARALSISRYGCRVVQSVLKLCSRADQKLFVENFRAQCESAKCEEGEGSVPIFCSDGSHVLQMMIQLQLPLKQMKFIQEALEADLGTASSDVSGCRVVQCFVNAYPSALNVSKLLTRRQHLVLSTREYANYVIQCVASKVPEFRDRLISDVFCQRNLYRLGTDKHGSNVLEKCVHLASNEQRARLINVLKAKRCALLKQLVWDKFGNYVVSTLLDTAVHEQRVEVVQAIHERVVDLSMKHNADEQRHGHSRELVAKCKRIRRLGATYRTRRAVGPRGGGGGGGRGRDPGCRSEGPQQNGKMPANGYKARRARYIRKQAQQNTGSGW